MNWHTKVARQLFVPIQRKKKKEKRKKKNQKLSLTHILPSASINWHTKVARQLLVPKQREKSSKVSAMGWLRLVGSSKLLVSFAEYRLFYRALLQKRPIILRSLLIVATPYTNITANAPPASLTDTLKKCLSSSYLPKKNSKFSPVLMWHSAHDSYTHMRWLGLVGSLKL